MTFYNISPAEKEQWGRQDLGWGPRGDRTADFKHLKICHVEEDNVSCMVSVVRTRTKGWKLETDLGKYEEDISNN